MPDKASPNPLIKICGITRAEDLQSCHEFGIEFVGFNFYPGSKRYIEPRAAFQIWSGFVRDNPGYRLKPVAVVVDESLSALKEVCIGFPALYALQLHGSEPEHFIKDLRTVFTGEVWKAVPVARSGDAARVEDMRKVADLVLLDSAVVPAGAQVPGGSGSTIDWQLFSQLIGRSDIGVAGGLTPDNISGLLPFKPFLVDLASGVEAAPGVKSREKIERLVNACRPSA